VAIELWINKKFPINTVRMWGHKNGSKSKNLKQSNGGWVQWLCRTVFHSSRPRLCDFGTYWLQRLSHRFFEQKPSLLTNLPQSQIYHVWLLNILLHENVARSRVGLLFLKNHLVVHLSPCCMFHASLCRARNSVAIFI